MQNIEEQLPVSENVLSKRPPKAQVSKKKKLAFKKWTMRQNLKYAQFLQSHSEQMSTEASRRREQVFKKMAKQIFRRSPEQCRTHHQKMLLRHGSIEGITTFFLNIVKEQAPREDSKPADTQKKSWFNQNQKVTKSEFYPPIVVKKEESQPICNYIFFPVLYFQDGR